MNKKTVLITGGSGFLGINLVRYLHNKGYNIKVIDIADFDYPDMAGKIDFYLGDIRNKNSVLNAMKNCDFVVHCAVALPLYPKKDIFSTNINGTRNVLECAKELKIDRVVHISSTAVYGVPDHHPIYEGDRLQGVGHYGITKVKAESICSEFRDKGLCVPVLRPKSFVGPERLGVMAIYYDWIKREKNIPIIGSGKNKYQLLDVEDMCKSIELCLVKDKEKVNDNFNIGAKEFTTMKEDFGAVLKHVGSKKRVVPLPAFLVVSALKVLEFFNLSPLYKWIYETASTDSFVSVDKAEKVLGFIPKYSTKEALIRNYDWYVNNLHTFENASGTNHRVPWKQGALKIVSWFF